MAERELQPRAAPNHGAGYGIRSMPTTFTCGFAALRRTQPAAGQPRTPGGRWEVLEPLAGALAAVPGRQSC